MIALLRRSPARPISPGYDKPPNGRAPRYENRVIK